MKFDWKRCLKQGGAPVDQRQLDQFEADIGCRLPDAYRDFILGPNGGRISFENEITLQNGLVIDLCDLFPLSAEMPDVGLKEIRILEASMCSGNSGWLRIGADEGTGYFYLSITPESFGLVAFAWKDDVPFLSRGEWMQPLNGLPSWLNFVSNDFDSLGGG